jgi:hypothetical protein
MPAPTAPFRKLWRGYPKPPEQTMSELEYEKKLTMEPLDLVMYAMKKT